MKNIKIYHTITRKFCINLLIILSLSILILSKFLTQTYLDLSAAKQYSISGKSQELLQKLDFNLVLNFYYGVTDDNSPKLQKLLQGKIDFLTTYAKASSAKIILNLVPIPRFSAIENQVLDLGFIGLNTANLYEKFYFGWSLAKQQNPQELLVSRDLILTGTENLEYQLAEDITAISNPRVRLGILSGVDFLPSFNFQTGKMLNANPAYFDLAKNYEIIDLSIDPKAQIDILLAIAPNFLLPDDLTLIQNLILQGTPSLVILDNINEQNFIDKTRNNNQIQNFLKKFGLVWQKDFIVADASASFPSIAQSGGLKLDENLINFTPQNFCDHRISKYLNSILVATPSAFEFIDNENYRLTPWIEFSNRATYINAKPVFAKADAENSALNLNKRNNAVAKKYFAGIISTDNDNKRETDLNAEINLAFIADADFLQAKFWLTNTHTTSNAKPVLIKKSWQDNLALVQNILDELADNSILLELRNKSLRNKTNAANLSKLELIEQNAKHRYLASVNKLEQQLAELELQIYKIYADLSLSKTARTKAITSLLTKRLTLTNDLNATLDKMQRPQKQLSKILEFFIVYFSSLLIFIIFLIKIILSFTKKY